MEHRFTAQLVAVTAVEGTLRKDYFYEDLLHSTSVEKKNRLNTANSSIMPPPLAVCLEKGLSTPHCDKGTLPRSPKILPTKGHNDAVEIYLEVNSDD